MARTAVDEVAVRAALGEQRRRLADHLDDLPDDAWSTPTLCTGWTVTDVVAHLTTTTRTSAAQAVWWAATSGLSFDRMTTRLARSRSSRFAPRELLAHLRETADSPRRMPGSAPVDPLVDLLVHGQDVSIPLGRPLPVPAALAVLALDHVADVRWWGAPQRREGLRLVASDTDWHLGEGPVVEGPAGSLLAAVLGRSAVVVDLTGPGTEVLAGRID